jgi:hypothetical protein
MKKLCWDFISLCVGFGIIIVATGIAAVVCSLCGVPSCE